MRFSILVLILLLNSCSLLKNNQEEQYKNNIEICIYSSLGVLMMMGVDPTDEQVLNYCKEILKIKDNPKIQLRPRESKEDEPYI